MAGLDNAGMHGPHRDLMERRAFRGEEGVSVSRGFGRFRLRPGRSHAPTAVIDPTPSIGRSVRFDSVNVANCALQPQGRRMHVGDGGKTSVGAFAADNPDV